MADSLPSDDQAHRFLLGRIDYERRVPRHTGRDFKLDRMAELLRRLGDPQDRIPAVHIAGTKGKGSTAAMTAAMLTAAGYRTGLFTSPHITQLEERIRVDGRMISPEELGELVRRLAGAVQAMDDLPGNMAPTFFEIITALGWLHFESRGCEYVVLEVGLGGRLDATNLCRPEVCVITSISHDHMALLGRTLEKIAGEKAGIIKTGVPVINGAIEPGPEEVIRGAAVRNHSELWSLHQEIELDREPVRGDRPGVDWAADFSGSFSVQTPHRTWADLAIPLRGAHQARNAALAVAAIDRLASGGVEIAPDAVRSGLRQLEWPLRVEVLQTAPVTIVDSAHNDASADALCATLEECFPGRRNVLVFAVTRDKDVAELARRLVPRFDQVVLTEYQTNPRALPAAELKRVVDEVCGIECEVVSDPADAWRSGVRAAGTEGLVCVTGSFFIASELRTHILQSQQRTQVAELSLAAPAEAPIEN